MFEKNDIIELNIEGYSSQGEGIGKIEGFPIFVKDTVKGDKIKCVITKVKKGYAYGKALEILSTSPNRIKSKCPISKSCGGCDFCHMNYEEEWRYKSEKVLNNLKKIGGFDVNIQAENFVSDKEIFRYRNKAQIPFGYNKNGEIVFGYYRKKSHEIIECEKCLLLDDEFLEICKTIKDFLIENNLSAYDEKNCKGLLRHVLIRKSNLHNNFHVCLIINGDEFPYVKNLYLRLSERFSIAGLSININKKNTNVILGDKTISLFGNEGIEEEIFGNRFIVSPESFLQVNYFEMLKLYESAISFLFSNEAKVPKTILDLYCGIGTISLSLFKKMKEDKNSSNFKLLNSTEKEFKKVIGIEYVDKAIQNARSNALLNGIEKTKFISGKVEDVLSKFSFMKEDEPYFVIVDPPRKGLDKKVIDSLLKLVPEKIVYVSCDSATLARDLKLLCEKEYNLEKVKVHDMFPRTKHVETLVLITRKDK